MGGIAILAGITVAYVVVGIVGEVTGNGGFTASGVLVLGLTLALGGLGFADDFIKLYKGRNLGLNKKAKLIGQFAAAMLFGYLILQFPDENGLTPGSTHLSFIRDIDTVDLALGGGVVGLILFLLFMYILISAWSNAVNLTDGLDGLAAESADRLGRPDRVQVHAPEREDEVSRADHGAVGLPVLEAELVRGRERRLQHLVRPSRRAGDPRQRSLLLLAVMPSRNVGSGSGTARPPTSRPRSIAAFKTGLRSCAGGSVGAWARIARSRMCCMAWFFRSKRFIGQVELRRSR